MNRRNVITSLWCVLSGIALWTVLGQSRQLEALHVEQTRLLAASSGSDGSLATMEHQGPVTSPAPTVPEASPELLRLRSQATLLAAKRAELLPLRAENKQLLSKIAALQTNASAALPAGYLRKSQAQLVGFARPEDTLQSFLWAVHNRDLTNLLQAITPNAAQQLQSQSGEAFFNQMQAFLGASVLEREQLPDGRAKLKVRILPDLPPADITFQNINGLWKMDLPR